MVTAFRESHIDNEVKKYLHHTLNAYYDGGEDKNALALGWDEIMTNLHCCGVEGWEDLKKAKRFVQYASAEGLGRQVRHGQLELTFIIVGGKQKHYRWQVHKGWQQRIVSR